LEQLCFTPFCLLLSLKICDGYPTNPKLKGDGEQSAEKVEILEMNQIFPPEGPSPLECCVFLDVDKSVERC